MKSHPTEILGQPSWRLASDCVDAAVTQTGGHLAPVRFHLPHGVVEPFSVAPWAREKLSPDTPPILRALRGDFFCAPFGASDEKYRGELHPVHGEPANARWKWESLEKDPSGATLHLSLRTRIRPGRIDKFIRLRRGETALYCRHVLSGMSGKMNFGHHATLRFPDAEGSGQLSTSRIAFGQVLPEAFEIPARGGYQFLKPGARFARLDRVPAIDGTRADLSSYPSRRGFEDLVMVSHQAAADFAWSAVSFPRQRYVWFALKDPRVLRSTVLWLSNGGRHYPPWSSRHVSVMGVEDVTSYFHLGLAASSRPNSFSRRGIPTCLELKRSQPLVVNYIMAVAAIPSGWGPVKTISRRPGGVVLRPLKGRDIFVPLDADFLYERPAGLAD